jgi:pheromone shutdown-related protein TraB
VERDYPSDVHIVRCGDKEIILVGTAHVSQESADLVRRVIENERPDRVCVELDEQRYKALTEPHRWKNLNIRQVIKNRQLPTLLVNLLLASYQRKLGGQLGVMPGTELLEATRAAEELDIPITLSDRNIRVTMLRAWRSMSFFQKMKLMTAMLASAFDDTKLSEEDLEKLRKHDVLTELMNELARAMPDLKSVVIDERDAYLAESIRTAEGKRIVAVVGAGHVEGIRQALAEPREIDLGPITEIPPSSSVWKWVGWSIPAIILGSLGLIAWTKGGDVAGKNLLIWIVANGVPTTIGAALAFGHPLTVLSAFVAAPITSLTPVIGAGYVTAFVQAHYQPPLVGDVESLADDAGSFRKWWSNRLLRVVLVFMFCQIGSMIGTYIGAYEILSNLF